jgi:hypothetical protein
LKKVTINAAINTGKNYKALSFNKIVNFSAKNDNFTVFTSCYKNADFRVDGQFRLKPLATVFAPEFDLIDFSVTPSGYLVGLWTNPDSLPVLRCFILMMN